MTIKDLSPQLLWKNFYEITRVPRPSKHEEKIAKYLYDWGVSHGFETIIDNEPIGNVIIRKPATPGCENLKGVILQGHMDMVAQKNADTVHDFENDPIETYIDGDWVRAKGTTLGADDGLGVAMALAILESDDIKHGPIEVLITFDEETGLTGAQQFKPGLLNGEILINLDSEDEGEICVGCAGGLDATASDTYTPARPDGDWECWSLAITGLRGGHSGSDIHLCRANANKVIARILYKLLRDAGVKLLDLEGGTLRNAIPREAFATVYIPKSGIAKAEAVAAEAFAEIKKEYAVTDPDAKMSFAPYVCDGTCSEDECLYVPEERALAYIRAILACPDGVERMSSEIEGLVETSNNLSIVKIEKGEFSVKTLMRSSVDTAKAALADKFEAVFALAGVSTTFTGGYSGWAPNSASPIVNTMKEVYEKLYGQTPKVLAIHAGLECGILGGTYPHWDMASYGSTLEMPHSPDERASISSAQRTWDYIKAVLEAIPEK